jgi:LmbE family N-acetylglucosaminyl deacetylase
MKTILCFAPHPDDEILGCGGSLIKAIKKSYKVHMCFMTYGEQGSATVVPSKLKKIRKQEAIKVCKYLGISQKQVHFLGIPDNEINWHDLKSMKKIMTLVRTIKPDIVYLPHERENYHDHQQANLLIMRALGMAGSDNFFESGGKGWWVETVLAYEVWTPMERYQYSEDISEEVDQKIDALKLYSSQNATQGNVSDFVGEKAKYLSGYRAAMTIGEHREMFQVLRAGNLL